MPFDAGVMAAVAKQLQLFAVGARIDKIYQPQRDEIVLNIRSANGNRRILLSASAGNSRVGFCTAERENPSVPPMFCMLLRKYLSGGHILSVRQIGFDRALEIKISCSDDMGFLTEKYLVCEIMGTYSNIVFLDENRKIVSVLHPVSLTTTNKRQVLCGFKYEDPPKQEGKINAVEVDKQKFIEKTKADIESGRSTSTDKYLISCYAGLSPLIAREIVYRTSGDTHKALNEIDAEKLWFNFSNIYECVKSGEFSPCLVKDKNGKVIDFSFCEIRQYGFDTVLVKFDNISTLLDSFYEQRDKQESIKQRAQDILKLLSNASARITKKIELQRESLLQCVNKDEWKRNGDLITANIYQLKKGQTSVVLIDYYAPDTPEVKLELDSRYTPSQNAQMYYKKYNKAKSAEVMLTQQIEKAQKELQYIDTVFESLAKAQTETDLSQIREELSITGYGKKLENLQRNMGKCKNDLKKLKTKQYVPLKFKTSGGYEVLCGKNNLQNDYITTSLASKDDYWFHIKKAPGSHVVMRCGKTEPSERDFTECAMIAAYYSSLKEMSQAPVDYTRVRNVKKPSGSKPGFVIYETNYTAFVTPDESIVQSLAEK